MELDNAESVTLALCSVPTVTSVDELRRLLQPLRKERVDLAVLPEVRTSVVH